MAAHAAALGRATFTCRRCLQVAAQHAKPRLRAPYSSGRKGDEEDDDDARKLEKEEDESSRQDLGSTNPSETEKGAMSRRLEQATEDALLTGGRAGRQAIQDAGFSDELKERLLDKIADANFKNEYSHAFSQTDLPSSAGEGSRHMAGAQPWTGEEDVADSVLRMLDDAKKPLSPELRGKYQPPPVDMRIRREPKPSAGRRVATARDKVAAYAAGGLTDKEKEAMREEFKERFAPGARAMPNTITGLASLANERIENAIARGQFKDIPRGTGVGRDARADNPFIDTTEYIMNKMIQRQDMVPPWIEKQQEVSRAAAQFRARLRSDWRRQAARMISAKGGSLQEQLRRAEEYAASEKAHNPSARSVVQDSASPVQAAVESELTKLRQLQQDKEMPPTEAQLEAAVEAATERLTESATAQTTPSTPSPPPQSPPSPPPPPTTTTQPEQSLPKPFRDPAWEDAERSYLTLAINSLNATTRSYNLMAPELARKPYFSLQRELASCYADVAPLLAGEIRERARGGGGTGARPTIADGREADDVGILGHFGKDNVRIHLEAEEKAYGLKEWWRDLWRKG